MPQTWMPRRYAVLLAAGLAGAAQGITSAQAQSSGPAQWPVPEQSIGPLDDPLFEQPFDFSAPMTGTSQTKIDPSKFTAITPPPSGWSAKAGVDYVPTTPASTLPSDLLLPNAPPRGQTGPAWANIVAPPLDTPLSWDKASIETRVDPLQDQSKLGMTFSRSVPIGGDLSVTLQNGYSMTQTLPNAAGTAPVMPASPPTSAASRVLDTNQALKFNVLPSDTSFSVGATMSTTDPKWLRSFSAEQKLFGGPLNITGSVSQTTTGEINKTLKGGFKQSW